MKEFVVTLTAEIGVGVKEPQIAVAVFGKVSILCLATQTTIKLS